MGKGVYPPSKMAKSDCSDYDDTGYFRSHKGRDRALMDLFRAGHTVEQISRLSCLSLGRLMQILGLETVVWDLFAHGRTMREICKMVPGLTLADVTKAIGGRTRSNKLSNSANRTR